MSSAEILPENTELQSVQNEATAFRNPGETLANPLSKRQLKKRRKMEKYMEIKKERRLKERERQKQKRQEALAQGLPTRTGPSRKELKKRLNTAKTDVEAPHIAIDLDFDDLMSERDIAKCVKQCLRIYTINRRAQRPVQLHLTGIKTDGHIHNCFKRNDGWENWHVQYYFDKTHVAAFGKEKIVYLTCESDAVLQKLEPERVYIIGGLVDHNHQKGLCHERAIKEGIETARLPLSENVDMKTRAVLSTYHVFEILLRVAEGKCWRDAILETVPMRKGASAKEANDGKPNESTDIAGELQPNGSNNILKNITVEEQQPSAELVTAVGAPEEQQRVEAEVGHNEFQNNNV